MSIFMMAQAVDAMEQAKEIGEKIQEEEQKEFFLTIVTAIFFFTPFLGEYAAAMAVMAMLALMIAMTGMAGDLGLALVDIIENPEMAPMPILGLLSAGRLSGPKAYKEAADARRSMSVSDLSELGDVFKKYGGTLQNIMNFCKK